MWRPRTAGASAVAGLDACDRWRKQTAAEGAAGAIDLSEEHHNIVRMRKPVIACARIQRPLQGSGSGRSSDRAAQHDGAISIQSMPISIHDAGRLANLAGDQL